MTHTEKPLSISSDHRHTRLRRPTNCWTVAPLDRNCFACRSVRTDFMLESALYLLPLGSEPLSGASLAEWNSDSLWRHDYGDLAAGLLFVAEDALQDQFCLSASGVLRFNAEPGGSKLMADSLDRWAEIILRDYDRKTGWTVAHQRQAANGPLPPGKKLRMKIPFFLEGAYSRENPWLGDAVEGMRFRADRAMQTRNLRDRTHVRMAIGEKSAN